MCCVGSVEIQIEIQRGCCTAVINGKRSLTFRARAFRQAEMSSTPVMSSVHDSFHCQSCAFSRILITQIKIQSMHFVGRLHTQSGTTQ